MVSKLTKKPENSSTGMAVTGPTKVATCQRNTKLHHYINIRQNMHFLLMASKFIDNDIEVFTCNEVDAAPINSPSDCATSDVSVPKARKSMKRTASEG